jgi:uncharacterized protein YdaU (DUF1376 family)
MKDVVETRGKNKAKMPWFKCYPDAWVRKTRTLSLEARAVYWDCLCLLYETEKPISQDDKWMAHYLHASTRLWRTLRDELVMGGYLRETPAGLVDERAIHEIENRSKQRRNNTEIALNRERTKREDSEKPKQINKTEARKQHHIEKKREEEKKENTEQAAAPTQEPARPEPSVAALPHLVDRLIEACNGSLDNPVNCMGLLSEATPQMWLDRGADLERDVIPTLQAAGKKYHGKRIRDWNYFTGMIADAVEKRKAELPAATPQKQTTSYSIGAKIKAYNERMKGEGAANV